MKNKVTINLTNKKYPILIGDNLLEKSGQLINKHLKNTNDILVISDKNVFSLYGDKLIKSLEKEDFNVQSKVIGAGEKFKTLHIASNLYDSLLAHNLNKDTTIISLGGGVIGDITGFVAATFMRGINFVQIPTTLLSQVDSSIGGKVAVNHPKGKNLIGTFYQPSLVISDVSTLKTLSEKEFLSGMGEVIKHGFGFNHDYFNYINSNQENIINLNENVLINLIYGSCQIKKDIVEKDVKDNKGIRAKLNLGHTIGHALEKITNYNKYLHGEAVAIGLIYETKLAHRLGLIKDDLIEKIEKSLKSFSLPTDYGNEIEINEIFEAIKYDKKVKNGKVNFSLPAGMGRIMSSSEWEKDDLKAILEK